MISHCWGIFRERAHSPGRENDDTEILRLTGKHLEARGYQVDLKDPEDVSGATAGRPRAIFLMCEREALKGDAASAARLHADERERCLDSQINRVLLVSQHRDQLARALRLAGPSVDVAAICAAAGCACERTQQDESRQEPSAHHSL